MTRPITVIDGGRTFAASELSDGTLRYLALTGALMAYRLPPFIALNEPGASLHPDLMEPLARMIARAAERTQIWLVTHSERLADGIATHGGARPRVVVKRDGETWIDGLTLSGEFADADDEAIHSQEIRRMLDAFHNVLSDRHRYVLSRRYGLEDNQFRTLSQVGKGMNLSRERVRQIEREALMRLREHANIRDHAAAAAALAAAVASTSTP